MLKNSAWPGRLVLFTMIASLAACSTVTDTRVLDTSVVGVAGYKDYVPIDPIPSPKVTYPDSNGNDVTKPWANLSQADRYNLLPNVHTEISVAKRDASGNLDYLVAKGAADIGQYEVIMDYTRYRYDDVVDKAGQMLGSGRVGVGMRMKATVQTLKANVDLSTPFKLGLAAATNQIRGTLSIDIYGIAGTDDLVLLPTPVDESSVQKALESLAGIKARLTGPTANFTPQLLWIKAFKDVPPKDIPKTL